MARKDTVTGEGNTFIWDKEGVRAIQETFSLNPDMLRHTQDAPEVPEEARKEYIEVVGAELATVPTFTDWVEDTFHKEGQHLVLTANTLGKVWSE